jgi:hypothetical protein
MTFDEWSDTKNADVCRIDFCFRTKVRALMEEAWNAALSNQKDEKEDEHNQGRQSHDPD